MLLLIFTLMSDINVILDILKTLLQAKPDSVFVNSLYQQYCNRGGLSKKQLEGLHSKASKVDSITPGKLATLEAIIKKKPTRYKSEVVVKNEGPVKDATIGQLIESILQKHPEHKRVLYLQSKYIHNDPLSPAEITEIQKFARLLV